MAAIRAFLIVVALAIFFLVGAPLQWFVARRLPRAAHRIPLLFCRSLLWLMRVRVAVDGARVTDRPVLMAANHVSWIDILALGTLTPFCFLAKREVAAWPILSAFAEVQGTVFVDRHSRRSIPGANRRMAERLRAGRAVLLFPEGTTIGAGEPAPFKSSHFAAARDFLRLGADQSEVPVQPVAIAYSSPAAAWVGDDALLPHVWRVLRGPPLTCSLGFLPPIAYGADTDRKAVAQACRDAVALAIRRARTAPAAVAVAQTSDLARIAI